MDVGNDCYHGVLGGETIYDVWPYPGEKAWGASYHSSHRFVAKTKTLTEMHTVLKARCCNPPNDQAQAQPPECDCDRSI